MSNIWEIPTVPGMGRGLIDHDPQNRNFPTRGVLHAADAPLVEKFYRGHWAYDQGDTPHCVAFSGKGMFNRAPFSKAHPWWHRYRIDTTFWYNGAQNNDEWPGIDYDGTSARGLLRFLTSIGEVQEYRWCFGVDDVLQTLSHHGPVSIGSWWTTDMSRPNPSDNYNVTYTGRKIGGHQWYLLGIDPENEEVEGMNTWGRSWGKKGRFRMKFSTLDSILKDDGDAYTLVTV